MSQNVQANVVDEVTQVDVNQQVVESPYKLPIATQDTLGGIKVGANLNIDEQGVLSAKSSVEVWEDLVNEILTEPKGFFEYNFDKKYKKLYIEIVGCGVNFQSFPQDMVVSLDTLDAPQPVLFCRSPNRDTRGYSESVFGNTWKRCILDVYPHQYGLKADFYVSQWCNTKEEVDYYGNVPDGQTSHGFVKNTFVDHILMLTGEETSAFVVGSTIKIKGVAL